MRREPMSDRQEQTATDQPPRKQPKFVIEEIGVGTAPVLAGGRINYAQLDGVIAKIQQRLGEQKTAHKNQHTQRVEQQDG